MNQALAYTRNIKLIMILLLVLSLSVVLWNGSLKYTEDGDRLQLPVPGGSLILSFPDGRHRKNRWKTVLQKNGSTAKTVIFAGDYERVTRGDTVTHLYYMGGNGIYVNQVKGSATLKRRVPCIERLSGQPAWGCHSFVIKDRSLILDRGYTGHEHLDEFGLINMNGRMYDPLVGRFLSPDPYVQIAGTTR